MTQLPGQLYALSASDLSRRYAGGDLSPVEVTESVLARIDRWEPRINAMYLLHREAALRAARESERRWRSGKPLSDLDGVPCTLKENIDTQGDPTPVGTAATVLAPKQADAPPAARLREAGAILLGKTTMPDFGMLSSGLSSIHGITRNPWRLDRNTSGSSSGAAAAAAAGYGPIHLGTDIGGSVRLPATHCGLFGLKPSLGRIPIDPPYLGRVAGPLTRTVLDAALALGPLSRPDVRDFMSLPYQPTDYVQGLDQLSLKGLRIGWLPDMKAGLPVHPEVAAAAREAALALQAEGAIVEPMDSFMTPAMLEGASDFFQARAYNDVVAMTDEQRRLMLPFILRWATDRAKDFPGSRVMGAYTQIVLMREAATRAAARYHFVLSPVSPIPPYEAESACPGNDPANALPHIAFTLPWNMSEHPAASINWGYTRDGLPLGVQLIGQRFDDAGVLRLARCVERIRPKQKAWPEPH